MNGCKQVLPTLLLFSLVACAAESRRYADTATDTMEFADTALRPDIPAAREVVSVADVAGPDDVGVPSADVAPGVDAGGHAGGDIDTASIVDTGLPVEEVLFSFAVLADPHIDGNPAHRLYLERAVELLVSERDQRDIELVFIVGDIAWGETDGRRHVEEARDILERLEDAGMNYVPVMGDNEVQYADDRDFSEVFGAQYARLAEVLEGWRQMPAPDEGPRFQSFSFEHRGCHFVSPDFISRDRGDEAATLHDYPGGTWPWFLADVATAAVGPAERISVFTHHGMFRTGLESVDRLLLSEADMTKIVEALCPYREHVAMSYGGHIHQNWYWDVACPNGERIYEMWSTDDCRGAVVTPEPDDHRITARIVDVIPSSEGFRYEQHVVAASTLDE